MYHLVNVTGTQTVVDVCLESSTVKKLVYTSSGSVVYDGVADITCADERLDYAINPMDAYNKTKAEAERVVLRANGPKLATCAIRPAGIFGPGDRQMIPAMYNVILNKQMQYQIGFNKNLQEFTYVDNVAHAHLLAVDKLHKSYSYADFRDPIPSIDLSLGSYRIPTSDAHPLGPNTSPSEADRLAARRFEAGEQDPADLRPVLRGRMDQFSTEANEEEQVGEFAVAGQAFFVTNGEPIYVWDFFRTVWREFGPIPTSVWTIPTSVGLVISSILEIIGKFTGKEPGFTRFRVAVASMNRYYDIERARRLLGYEPIVGLDEGVKRWTAWYKEELAKKGSVGETEKTK